MKPTLLVLVLAFCLSSTPAQAGAGVIIESIKSHLEHHQDQWRHQDPRQPVQRTLESTPQTVLEHWVQSLLEVLSRAK